MKSKVKELIRNNTRPCVYAKSYPDILNFIKEETSFLPEDSSLTRRLWHFEHELFYVPKCLYCDNEVFFRKRANTYLNICYKCAKNSEQANREQSNIKKYGTKSTLLVREFRDKSTQTKIKKYGTPFVSAHPDIRKKIIDTTYNHYNVNNVSQHEEIKTRKECTSLTKYGVSNPLKSKKIQEKIKQTNFNKFGTEYPTQSELVKEKIKKTCNERYGRNCHKQKHIPLSSLETLSSYTKLSELCKTHSAKEIGDMLKVDSTTVLRYMHTHNIEPSIFYSSAAEKEIREIFKDFNCVFNDRNKIGMELDIYIPELNLAVEYNGLYWHSEHTGTDKYLHVNKLIACKNNGIRLITIFENEWLEKRDLVAKKLKHIAGISTEAKEYARSCTIQYIDSSIKDKFLDANHIQGTAKSSVNIGLYNKAGTLVACMAFTKSNDKFVLTRYATSCNVVGGFSKLLKYFEIQFNYPPIITFADLRWSNGDLYYNTGFKEAQQLPIDYYWTKNNKLWHKFNWRHKQMRNRLKYYNPNKSESENMRENGYAKIWDCGKIKFTKNI